MHKLLCAAILLGSVLSIRAEILADFSQPGHGWVGRNHVQQPRQTDVGYCYEVNGDDPWLVGPMMSVPACPSNTTWVVYTVEADVPGSGNVTMFWSKPNKPNTFSPERQLNFVRVDGNHWRGELLAKDAPKGNVNFRLDLGDSVRCPQVEMRKFSVDYQAPLCTADAILRSPNRWVGEDGIEIRNGELTLTHSRQCMGSFRLTYRGKTRIEGGGDGDLVVLGKNGNAMQVQVEAKDFAVRNEGNSLMTSQVGKDGDGGVWRVERTFVLGKDGMSVKTMVACDRASSVLHLPYLTAIVDRASKGHKAQAMLPGLEYLADEPSSNEKEIAGAPANRVMPSLDKFCYPMMLLTDGEDYVSMRWKVDNGRKPGFSPVFDSPDRVFGTGGHLFALWAPMVGECRKESEFDVYHAMKDFTNGTCEVCFQVGHGVTIADALADLLPASSLPELPPMDVQKSLSLLAHGWLDSRIREGNLVKHAVGSRFPAKQVADAPALIRYLASQLADRKLAARSESVADSMVAAFPTNSPLRRGYGNSVSHIGLPAAPLAYGEPLAYARCRRNELLGLLKQVTDGKRTWKRPANKPVDYGRTLDADHCNGFTSMVASPIAEAATWIGDEALIGKALITVDQVIERYRGTVPCGAQPWEMPLHCPDIVASGRLVLMCKGAWLLTGEARYLDEARYWARTGLTMVYLDDPIVDAPDFCGRYATIGVMGATNWTVPNWIGRPVQWCGLVYSRSLFDLADIESDGQLSAYWRKIASGITISGLDQSFPMDDTDNMGLLPDSTLMIDQTRADPPINPGTVEENLSYMLPVPYYRCVRVCKGVGRSPLVHVAGTASVQNSNGDDCLSLAVDAWPRSGSKVLVSRMARPSSVLVGGKQVSFDWEDNKLVFAVPSGKSTISIVYR